MKRLLAIATSSLLILTGCASESEIGEVSSAIQDIQEMEAEESATTGPEPLPTFQLSSLNEDPEVCKIREDTRLYSPSDPVIDFSGLKEIKGGLYKGNATAFPFRPTTLPIYGELNVVFVPVDWSDAQGDQVDWEFYHSQAQTFADFWFMVSEGNLSVNVTMPEGWFRMPGTTSDFYMTGEEEGQRYEFRPKKQALYDAIIEVSDASIDFSETHIVFPVWPLDASVSEGGPHEFNFDWNAAMYTNEGTIYDIAGAGDWFINHVEYGGPWFYYVHEVGHMLGFVHLPDESGQYNDLEWNEWWWLQNGTSGVDVMGNQDGAVKTIGSWLRWVAGWLDDSQVICVTEESIEDEYFELSHLNDVSGGVESLVIKLSDTQVVVVESRRWDERFDRPIVHSRDGIFAYVVTSTKGASQNSQLMLSPRKIQDWVEVDHWRGSEEIDATFCEGDSAYVSNLKIEAVSLQDGKDYVRVTKTDEWVDPSGPAAGSVVGQPNFLDNGCVFPPGADREYRRSLGLKTSS